MSAAEEHLRLRSDFGCEAVALVFHILVLGLLSHTIIYWQQLHFLQGIYPRPNPMLA